MRVQGLLWGSFLGAAAWAAGCAESSPQAQLPGSHEVAARPGLDAEPELSPDSERGWELLGRLREQHVARTTQAAVPRLGVGGAARDMLGGSVLPKDEPVLVPGRARFAREAQWLVPVQDDGKPLQTGAELALPARASGAFRLKARGSQLALSARLRETRDVAGEPADGYVVYPNAGPSGSTLLHRATDEGTEDYLTFERAPSAPEVSYQVELSAQVAGLRLVSNTLELLDAGGDPKLRVEPPYLISADGSRVEAQLAVRGCNVDDSPVEPWDRPTTDPGARSCDVHVSWDGAAVEYPAVLDPSWSTTGQMVASRSYPASAVLSTGRVLAAGGKNSAGTVLASAEIYNPTTRTWSTTGSMATARMYAAGVRLASGNVLVAGGESSAAAALASAEQFNSSTGTFATASSMVTARRTGFTATLLTNNKVLVVGGFNSSGNRTANAELYTPPAVSGAGTWASTTAMAVAQADHVAVRLTSGALNGRVLVAGFNAPSAQLFNPTGNTWSSTAAMKVPRQFAAATVLNDGKVLVVGGIELDAAGSAEVFDPNLATPTWTRTGSPRYPRSGATATKLSDGRVLVYGLSLSSQGGGDKAAEVFNPTWGTWIPQPDAATMRLSGHLSHLLGNGRVLIAGGYSTGLAATRASEEYISTTTPITVSEYRPVLGGVPAVAIDPTVTEFEETELWAAVYRPTTLAAFTRYPLLVFLHGNHQTCGWGSNPRKDETYDYTFTGSCPTNVHADNRVVPSHMGYGYVAEELAARGYIVVSINANRINSDGIGPDEETDPFMVTDRGRLILRHLQLISRWDRGLDPTPASIGVSLANKIDFDRVGLLGHSRGGEAVRTAYSQYLEQGSLWPGRIVTPVNVRGIFEIAPVDRMVPDQVFDAYLTRWAVLLPMCDGDIDDFWGIRPFDRMMHPDYWFEFPGMFKASYTVYGANHFFYNTEWQKNDSDGCLNHRPMFDPSFGVTESGSAEQRQTGLLPILAFFQTTIAPAGGSTVPAFHDLFDPRFPAPFSPRVDRTYNPASEITNHSWPLEEFTVDYPGGYWGMNNQSSGLADVDHTSVWEHDATLRGANIKWTAAGGWYRINFPSVDLTWLEYLELRVDRLEEFLPRTYNTSPSTDFQVRLVNSNGTTLSSPVSISSYVKLNGPDGQSQVYQHSPLQTVRIPLSAFTGATLTAVRGVRFDFNSTPRGYIAIANVRATDGRANDDGQGLAAASSSLSTTTARRPALPPSTSAAASTAAPVPLVRPPTRIVHDAPATVRTTASGGLSFELRTRDPLRAHAEGLYLRVGPVLTYKLVEHNDGTRLVFELTAEEAARLVGGETVVVQKGINSDPVERRFGTFDPSRVVR
jgi:hypothetical protein